MGFFGKIFGRRGSPGDFDFDSQPDFGKNGGLSGPDRNLGLPKSNDPFDATEQNPDTQANAFLKDSAEFDKPIELERPAAQQQQPQQGFNPSQPFKVAPEKTQDFDFRVSKDFEIISTKLDALRSALDSMNQRLMNVEEMVRHGQEKRRTW